MRVRLVLVAVLAVFVTVTVAWSFARRPGVPGRQQEAPVPAPAFSVSRYTDGRSLSLSDLRGKVVLLYFFFPS